MSVQDGTGYDVQLLKSWVMRYIFRRQRSRDTSLIIRCRYRLSIVYRLPLNTKFGIIVLNTGANMIINSALR